MVNTEHIWNCVYLCIHSFTLQSTCLSLFKTILNHATALLLWVVAWRRCLLPQPWPKLCTYCSQISMRRTQWIFGRPNPWSCCTAQGSCTCSASRSRTVRWLYRGNTMRWEEMTAAHTEHQNGKWSNCIEVSHKADGDTVCPWMGIREDKDE